MQLDKEGATWADVPKETRDFYWDEFKKHYWWEVNEETVVKTCWEKTMSKSYAGLTYKWRKKDKRPDTCSEEAWNAWKVVWSSPEFLKKSLKQKANRMSERGGDGSGPSRHTSGSRSIADHRREIERKEGAPPSLIQLFDKTHMTKTDNGTRWVYVDDRATKFVEKLNKRKNLATSNRDGSPLFDSEGTPVVATREDEDRFFLETIHEDISDGGRPHRYMYGTGSNKEHSSVTSDASTATTQMLLLQSAEVKELINDQVKLLVQEQVGPLVQEKVGVIREELKATFEERVRQVVAQIVPSMYLRDPSPPPSP